MTSDTCYSFYSRKLIITNQILPSKLLVYHWVVTNISEVIYVDVVSIISWIVNKDHRFSLIFALTLYYPVYIRGIFFSNMKWKEPKIRYKFLASGLAFMEWTLSLCLCLSLLHFHSQKCFHDLNVTLNNKYLSLVLFALETWLTDNLKFTIN